MLVHDRQRTTHNTQQATHNPQHAAINMATYVHTCLGHASNPGVPTDGVPDVPGDSARPEGKLAGPKDRDLS